MMGSDFHWLRPEWLLILPLIFFLIFIFKRRLLSVGNWVKIIEPKLIPHVLSRQQLHNENHKWWLFAIISFLGVISIAGPTWERVEQPAFRADQSLVIALDLSRSMNAQDVSPTRLTRARLKILDILERRQSAQIALIVYSANAFTVTPLTSDSDTITSLVNSLDTAIMPSRGSYPAAAIDKGMQLLKQAGVINGEILLVTDGGVTSTSFSSAEKLRNEGYTLSVLGVGTMDGAPIPRESGGFITDQSGQIAIAKLSVGDLSNLARIGGGRYVNLTADDRDLDLLLSDELIASSQGDQSLATDQWYEFGPWLLLILVPIASLVFQRGWVFVFLICVAPIDQPAFAFEWIDLWKTKDQQAKEAMDIGDHDKAIELFEDPQWLASANYNAGNYSESAQAFFQTKDFDGLYNYGNSLAKMGQFSEALEAYEEVIENDSDAKDAIYNRDLIKELLQKNKSSQNDNQNDQSSNEGTDGEKNQEQADGESQSSSAEGGSDGTKKDNENEGNMNQEETSQDDLEAIERELEKAAQEDLKNQQESETESEGSEGIEGRVAQEQQQALEQWLRRIPDDPGGLLRRKFRYQYQRQGFDQDGNQLWPDDGVQPW